MKQHEILSEEEILNEVNMSPSALRDAVKKIPGARAGLEFELIVTADGDDVDDDYDPYEDFDSEPDYDMDEYIRESSWGGLEGAVMDFFRGDHNSRRQITTELVSAREDYEGWLSNKFVEWGDGYDTDSQLTRLGAWIEKMYGGVDPKYQGELFGDEPLDAFASFKKEYFTNWIEMSEEESDFIEKWLEDQCGGTSMSDFGNTYDLNWPHWTEPDYDNRSSRDGGPPIGSFSSAVGMNVDYSGSYHGRSKSLRNYTVEPDSSLRANGRKGGEGWEFVSPPLPVDDMIEQLRKVAEWAKSGNAYTNDSTGLHMNISLPGYNLAKLDYVKLALFLGDKYVLETFGRLGNTYAESAFEKITSTIKNNPDRAGQALDLLRKSLNLEAGKAIHSGQTQKFVSINTKDNRVEFRSPGGNWLDMDLDTVVNTILRTVLALDIAMDPTKEVKEYQKKYYKLLSQAKGTDNDTIKYFVQYASGNLPKTALLSFVRDAQRKRDVAKGKDTKDSDNRTNLAGTTPPAEYNPKYSIYLPNTNMTARDIPNNEPVVQYVRAWAERRNGNLDTIRILSNETGMLYDLEGNRDRNLRSVDLGTVRRPVTAQIRYYVKSGTPENNYNMTSFVADGDSSARSYVTDNRPYGQWFLIRDDKPNESIMSVGPASDSNAAPQSSSASTIPDLTSSETTGGQLYQMLRPSGPNPVIAQGRFNDPSEAVQRFGAYADANNIARNEYHVHRPTQQPEQAASQGGQQFEIVSGGNVIHRFNAASQPEAYQIAVRYARDNGLVNGRWTWRTVGGERQQSANPEGPMYEIVAEGNIVHEFRAVSPRAAERYAQSWVDEHLGDFGYDVRLASRNESLGESILNEINMSPTSLQKFADSPFAQSMKVGFETELYVPDLENDNNRNYSDSEEDMDEDISFPARANYIDRRDRVTVFFIGGDNQPNDRSDIRAALDETDEAFMEWVSEEFYNYKDSSEYKSNLARHLADEGVDTEDEDAVEAATEEFEEQEREEYENEEARWREFLSEKDIDSMHDWMRWVNRNSPRITIYWPYMIYRGGGDLTRDDIADLFTQQTGLGPTKVGDGYHSVKRDETHWIFEPDGSLDEPDDDNDGSVEIVSPPMSLENALSSLETVFKWASKNGYYTNQSTGFHMGVSIPEQTMENIDHLKVIMLLGDNYVLKKFNRYGAYFAQSTIDRITEFLKNKDREGLASVFDEFRNGIREFAYKEINKLLLPGADHRLTVNIKKTYIEFRAAGDDYLPQFEEIRKTMLRYVRVLAAAADPEDGRREYQKKLYKNIMSSIKKSDDTVDTTINILSDFVANPDSKKEDLQPLLLKLVRKSNIARTVPKTIGSGETQVKVFRRKNDDVLTSDDQISTINATTVNELVKYAREMADKANMNYEDIVLKPVAKYFIRYRIETGDARENYGIMALGQNRNYNLGIAADLMNVPKEYAEKVIKFYIEHQYALSNLVSDLSYIKLPTKEAVDRAISLVNPEQKNDNPDDNGPGRYAIFVQGRQLSADRQLDSKEAAEDFFSDVARTIGLQNWEVKRVQSQQPAQQRQSAQQERQDLTLVRTIGNPNLRTPNYIFYVVNSNNVVVLRIQAATIEDANSYLQRDLNQTADGISELNLSVIPSTQWHS